MTRIADYVSNWQQVPGADLKEDLKGKISGLAKEMQDNGKWYEFTTGIKKLER